MAVATVGTSDVATPAQLYHALGRGFKTLCANPNTATVRISKDAACGNVLNVGLKVTLVAIALAESGGRMNAENSYVSGGRRYYVHGPWQISDVHGFNAARLKSDLDYSALCACVVYFKQGLSAWSVWKSGAYKAYRDDASRGIKGKAAFTQGGTGGNLATDIDSWVREQLGGLISALTSVDTWIRVGAVIGGAVLLFLAVSMLFKQSVAPAISKVVG